MSCCRPRCRNTISIHVPLAGDDMTMSRRSAYHAFLSTSPLRGTTVDVSNTFSAFTDFYPRPPCGGRRLTRYLFGCLGLHFYPRPPCGGRPRGLSFAGVRERFLSTSPLRGTTDIIALEYIWRLISIHVPLAGDDAHSAATARSSANFYPRPPCGGRQEILRRRYILGQISIHVPLAGDDPVSSTTPDPASKFLSTSPLRGTTGYIREVIKGACISIHVPLAGDDGSRTFLAASERLISIHVPLAGDDTPVNPASAGRVHFYPRPPCGGRPSDIPSCIIAWLFLSTSPLRGTTSIRIAARSQMIYFYPRPPCGGRPAAAA